MPHLKVNVNGKKYTISGITRTTCSKQILCALAKVDAELRSRQTTEPKGDPLVNASGACVEQNRRAKKVRETRKEFKREEKCTRSRETEKKQREGRKRSSGKEHITKPMELTNNEGIQTSSGMFEAVEKSSENQQNCSPSLNERESVKEKVVESSFRTVEDLDRNINGRDTSSVDSRENNVEDGAKDTDHDTGISELQSDSSFEQNQILHQNSGVNGSSARRTLNSTLQIKVKCASTNTDTIEFADLAYSCMLENSISNLEHDEYIVAELIGSETDVEIFDECTCTYIDSETEELQQEIEKIRDDLKLTESKLIEQEKTIETLNVLIDDDDDEYCANCDVNDDVNKRIDELKQSIKLSTQLYDYQKVETQANALELEKVESQIRRKRWHVECLLKELHMARNSPLTGNGQGKSAPFPRDGTLV